MKKMNLTELTNLLNESIDDNESSDSRVSSNVSERRVRDYISKGIVDQGIKEGRNTYYTNEHLQQLIEVRKLQSGGLSDKAIKNISVSYYSNTDNLDTTETNINSSEQDLDSLLNSIEEKSQSNLRSFDNDSLSLQAMPIAAVSKSNLYGATSSLIEEETIKPIEFEEYSLSENSEIVLKFQKGFKIKDKNTLLKNIKHIIDKQETDHD